MSKLKYLFVLLVSIASIGCINSNQTKFDPVYCDDVNVINQGILNEGNSGNVKVQTALGVIYQEGKCGEKDLNKAHE